MLKNETFRSLFYIFLIFIFLSALGYLFGKLTFEILDIFYLKDGEKIFHSDGVFKVILFLYLFILAVYFLVKNTKSPKKFRNGGYIFGGVIATIFLLAVLGSISAINEYIKTADNYLVASTAGIRINEVKYSYEDVEIIPYVNCSDAGCSQYYKYRFNDGREITNLLKDRELINIILAKKPASSSEQLKIATEKAENQALTASGLTIIALLILAPLIVLLRKFKP